MASHSKAFLLAGFFAAGLAAAAPAAQEDEPQTAQALLFDKGYLLRLGAPSRLVYSFKQSTADAELFGQGFEDEVTMRLSASAQGNGQKDVTLDMFTGERQRTLGPLSQVSGNPIIMMFLERDVLQMNRHIGGQPVYFRNVIRLAFREKARVEPASFVWDGLEVRGAKITIQPFLGDPHGERMQLFKSKTYEFIVSEAVPGGVYAMHATLADTRIDATAPAVDMRLTLKGIIHDQPKN